jgi:hypothetical protein
VRGDLQRNSQRQLEQQEVMLGWQCLMVSDCDCLTTPITLHSLSPLVRPSASPEAEQRARLQAGANRWWKRQSNSQRHLE